VEIRQIIDILFDPESPRLILSNDFRPDKFSPRLIIPSSVILLHLEKKIFCKVNRKYTRETQEKCLSMILTIPGIG